jgi:hypothetical protein
MSERALPLTAISWNQAQAAAGVADDTGNGSYSDYDTEKCGIPRTDRNDFDNGSLSVDVGFQRPQFPAGLGSCGNAVVVVHLCVCVLQCGCVFLRVL